MKPGNYYHADLPKGGTFKVPIAASWTGGFFFYKIQVNPIHTILKYGDYYDFMDR